MFLAVSLVKVPFLNFRVFFFFLHLPYFVFQVNNLRLDFFTSTDKLVAWQIKMRLNKQIVIKKMENILKVGITSY